MRRTIGSLVAVALCNAALLAQAAPGPYAGQQAREIKGLSPEQVAAYAAGEGMGYAKAAELNHYPGPKHVLELAEPLALEPEQTVRIREIHRKMRQEAVRLGAAILEKERALDRLFAERRITAGSLSSATAEIARLDGELRATHLAAHLETRAVLTDSQVAAYDELRGYGKDPAAAHHHGAR
jgi:hypothetical protein